MYFLELCTLVSFMHTQWKKNIMLACIVLWNKNIYFLRPKLIIVCIARLSRLLIALHPLLIQLIRRCIVVVPVLLLFFSCSFPFCIVKRELSWKKRKKKMVWCSLKINVKEWDKAWRKYIYECRNMANGICRMKILFFPQQFPFHMLAWPSEHLVVRTWPEYPSLCCSLNDNPKKVAIVNTIFFPNPPLIKFWLVKLFIYIFFNFVLIDNSDVTIYFWQVDTFIFGVWSKLI